MFTGRTQKGHKSKTGPAKTMFIYSCDHCKTEFLMGSRQHYSLKPKRRIVNKPRHGLNGNFCTHVCYQELTRKRSIDKWEERGEKWTGLRIIPCHCLSNHHEQYSV